MYTPFLDSPLHCTVWSSVQLRATSLTRNAGACGVLSAHNNLTTQVLQTSPRAAARQIVTARPWKKSRAEATALLLQIEAAGTFLEVDCKYSVSILNVLGHSVDSTYLYLIYICRCRRRGWFIARDDRLQ